MRVDLAGSAARRALDLLLKVQNAAEKRTVSSAHSCLKGHAPNADGRVVLGVDRRRQAIDLPAHVSRV